MVGEAERDQDGNTVIDAAGKERLVIIGGKGDQGLKRMINYLRRKVWPTPRRSAHPANAELESESV